MKIGFIAMSGIRVRDAELLELGLTLPGFVERSRTIASLPSLGLLTLAGMTPPRHEVRYLEVPDLPAAGTPGRFDLVAISSFSAQIGEAYALADRFRAEGVPVVLGGLHVTALPDEALAHADAVVVGEGEPVWPAVLEDAARGRLRGIYGDREGRFDLAQAPMPAFHLLEIGRYNRLTLQTSRGCPHLCEFCASSVLLAPRYKLKPAGKVLAEIERILSIWPRPFLEFADDNSFVDRAYWHDLLPALRGRRLRWFAETDLSVADDEDLLALMREAGCAEVLIGFESPRRDPLRGIELRADWKARRWVDAREAVRRIQSHGIRVNGCFVLGLDGHGPEVFDDVASFAESTELWDVQVTVLTPFPGTPLHARLKSEGRLLHEGAWERCTLFDVNYRPAGMTPEDLRAGLHDLALRLYGEEATKKRRARFRERMRAGRSSERTVHA